MISGNKHHVSKSISTDNALIGYKEALSNLGADPYKLVTLMAYCHQGGFADVMTAFHMDRTMSNNNTEYYYDVYKKDNELYLKLAFTSDIYNAETESDQDMLMGYVNDGHLFKYADVSLTLRINDESKAERIELADSSCLINTVV